MVVMTGGREAGDSWHLAGQGQGQWGAFSDAQSGLMTKEGLAPNVHSAEGEQPGTLRGVLTWA